MSSVPHRPDAATRLRILLEGNRRRHDGTIRSPSERLAFAARRGFHRIACRTFRRSCNPVTGYQRFDLPLLVTYPGSGTNWMRYLVEELSGKPTPGATRIYGGHDYCLDRAHCGWKVMDRYSDAILLLRDYRECLMRRHRFLWHETRDVDAFMKSTWVWQSPDWYVRNLVAFDSFPGRKLLLHYEDLLARPEPNIRTIAEFFGFPEAAVAEFLENYSNHVERSVDLYSDHRHLSGTRGDPRQLDRYAGSILSEFERKAFDDWFRAHHAGLFERYLEVYAKACVNENYEAY